MRSRKCPSKWKEAQTSRLPTYAFYFLLISKLYQSNLIRHVFSQLPWRKWYPDQVWAQTTLLRTWLLFQTVIYSPKEVYIEPQHINRGGCPDLRSSFHFSNFTCLLLSWMFFYPQMAMAPHGPDFHQTRYYQFHEFERTLEKKSVLFTPSAFPVIEKH